MNPFKRILCAVDFSSITSEVVSRAYGIGLHDEEAVVCLCHVVQEAVPNPLYAHYHSKQPDEARKAADEKAREALEACVPHGTDDANVKTVFETPHGDPVLEVIRIAREFSADVVVMGTHGRTGLQNLLLGSVAEGVVKKAPCPVLVIKANP